MSPWPFVLTALFTLAVQAPLIWIVWVGSLRQHAEDRALIQDLTAAFLALKVPDRPHAAMALAREAEEEDRDEGVYDETFA